jgi:transposase
MPTIEISSASLRASPGCLSEPRVHASQEEIAKSLDGNWHSELLFVMQQEVDMYDTYQKRITKCD